MAIECHEFHLGNENSVILTKNLSCAMAIRRALNKVRTDGTDRNFRAGVVDIQLSSDINGPCDIAFVRRGDGIRMLLSKPSAQQMLDTYARVYASTVIYWMLNTKSSVKAIRVNCSDGESASEARFAFSSARKEIIAIPDPHIFLHRGYRRLDTLAENSTDSWWDRSDEIVWRGAATGVGHMALDDVHSQNPLVKQRIRMAFLTRGSDVDFKFVDHENYRLFSPIMDKQKLLAPSIKQESWIGRKYAIDIDGNTNTWGNFIARLKLGCCVLKVDSGMGYKQWYYDRIKPWEHYVPVKSDMSDFFEKVEWVRANEKRAFEIAQNGQEFARSITFESARADAIELIERNSI